MSDSRYHLQIQHNMSPNQSPTPLESSSAPNPHFGVILPPRSQRLACDHCHFQKLRCTVDAEGQGERNVCQRCQRLKKTCTWTPPSKSGRPVTKTASKRSQGSIDGGGEKSRKRRPKSKLYSRRVTGYFLMQHRPRRRDQGPLDGSHANSNVSRGGP